MKILLVGHSHITALERAVLKADGWATALAVECRAVQLLSDRFKRADARPALAINPIFDKIDLQSVVSEIESGVAWADLVVLGISGNEHSIFGLSAVDHVGPIDDLRARTRAATYKAQNDWLEILQPLCGPNVMLLPPPPPIESEHWLRANPGTFAAIFADKLLLKAASRLTLWRDQIAQIKAIAADRGIEVVDLPSTVFSESGFLHEKCMQRDPTHANFQYGRAVIDSLIQSARHKWRTANTEPDRKHPYVGLHGSAFWQQAVVTGEGLIDPVVNPPFKIRRADKIATAGSCFAQHISKRLRDNGFKFFVAEGRGRDGTEPDYAFSARYGNVYTARQLLQLFERAFGIKSFSEAWKRPDGRWCDPFRPRIRMDGYESIEELEADRGHHLAAVRRMFIELDVFVFTLGLTECFADKLSGAVYPLAPGVAGGSYNSAVHEFMNFGAQEVAADLASFLEKLRVINPSSKVILTVSPVPLIATYENRHVLVSTVLSKSVLRVAADEIETTFRDVYYFPSYEIITGKYSETDYFAADRREVTQAGVNHVMKVFMDRLTESASIEDPAPIAPRLLSDIERAASNAATVACDEEALIESRGADGHEISKGADSLP